jgi:hypothetical protein
MAERLPPLHAGCTYVSNEYIASIFRPKIKLSKKCLFFCLAYSSTLTMKATCSSEMSDDFQHGITYQKIDLSVGTPLKSVYACRFINITKSRKAAFLNLRCKLHAIFMFYGCTNKMNLQRV